MSRRGAPVSRTRVVALLSVAVGCLTAPPLVAQSTGAPPTTRGGAPQVVIPTAPTAAQEAASRALGRRVSNEEIGALLTRSGLSEAQVRVRLEQAGYDGRLAEPFFTAMRGDRAALQRPADSTFVAALLASELVSADALQPADATAATPGSASRASDPRTAAERAADATVFGKALFADRGAAFDPVRSGPVDGAYRLGPGDVVQVVLTGDVEATHTVDVRPDGAVLLPRLGQVGVSGLTVEAARTTLRTVAQRSYDGIAAGRVRLDLAVTRVRTIAVLVVGEVEHPGTYAVSGGGTVLHALGRAGGPTVRGSFRAVELRRGGALVATIDLYDLLLRGDLASDKRLEQGDVIHVPLAARTVGMVGAFRRPSTFELRSGERFADVLRFAGGFSVDAAATRVQVDRVLPVAQRSAGRTRVLLDVPLPAGLDTVPLLDGDVVTAFHLDEVRRNHVAIAGEVHMPGRYELTAGLTVGDLVTRADGATPWALTDRVKVVRTVPRTGRAESFSLDLARADDRAFRLQEYDSVSVLDGRLLYPGGTITVSGAVHAPRRVAHAAGLTLVDAIDVAGGLTDEAQVVEVSRRPRATQYTDTAAVVLRVPVAAVRARAGEAQRFVLERDDQVQVRASPGYRALAPVTVSGLFTYPGTYFLQRDSERLSELVARAGGLQPTAYRPSFRLIRGGRVVAVDLDRALAQDAQANIGLLAGDQVRVGPDPGVVYVTGAVERQVAVPYRRGLDLQAYLAAAGGVSQAGDANKLLIELPSGEVLRPRRGRFVIDQHPTITGGSTITVLTRREKTPGQWSQQLTTIAQVATSLVSLVLAYVAVTQND